MKIRIVVLFVLGAGIVLAGVAGAVMAAANWSDDPLSAESQKLLVVAPAGTPDASNAYFTLLGMGAAKDQDAQEAGLKYQAALDQEYKANPLRASFTEFKSVPDDAAAWNKLRCPMQGEDCVDFYLRNKQTLQAALKENDYLIQCYEKVTQMPALEERPMLSVAAPFPKYALYVRAAELQLVAAVYLMDGGEASGGFAALTRKIAADRKLLAASHTLIFKMINVAVLRRDYEVLSEAMEHWPQVIEANREQLAAVLRPLEANELDMSRVLGTENLFAANMMLHLTQTVEAMGGMVMPGNSGSLANRGEQVLVQCCYLPQASLNMVAPVWNLRADVGTGGPAKIDERKQQLADAQLALAAAVRGPLNKLRNPVGKMLMAMNDTDYFGYVERVYDLDGYIRLVSLQAAIKRDKVAADKVSAYVAQAPAEMRNPYNGKSMSWDAATSTLIYTGRQDAPANPATDKKQHGIRMKFA